MIVLLIAALIVFGFTAILTPAGVGAAFSIIPFLYWLGFPLTEAMATCLLLNSISMSFATITFIRNKLVVFKTALPIIIASAVLSPLGAFSTRFVSRDVLLWLFAGFLLFVASMMLFFKAQKKDVVRSDFQEIAVGLLVGCVAGYLGGLLGVGGGNIIVVALIWVGFDTKKAAATSAFVVIFSSLAAFLSHAALGHVNIKLLSFSVLASIAGGLLGAWLLAFKLKGPQVKRIIGIVLYLVAAKMILNLI